jgi:hypothetical protein
MTEILKYLLKYEEKWCSAMGYFNPYLDPFKYHLTNKMPIYDIECYNKYPYFRHVYDKLWIVKSQSLKGGKLEELTSLSSKKINQIVKYPIFIKPRWGHLSATSKNCFKINNTEELNKYKQYHHMIWSEFINGTEGMTDYILLNGKIIYQLTYIYSEKQNGFTDEWKLVSPLSTPPINITEWVENNMRNFTGVVNAQYRNNKIIEISLRLARGGAYILSTKNEALIKNINNIFINQFWDFSLHHKMNFKPFYVFKSYTKIPIICLFPQSILDLIIKKYTSFPFYEYYFEPAGNEGTVFLQFMDDNFEKGMKTKKKTENLFNILQTFMYVLISLAILQFFLYKSAYNYPIIIIVFILWALRFLNPISTNYNLCKTQKQLIFNEGPPKDITKIDDIETFTI